MHNLGSHPVTEEEELMTTVNFKTRNISVTDVSVPVTIGVSLSSVLPAVSEVYTNKENVLGPPITVHKMQTIDQYLYPPSLDILHNLFFEGTLDIRQISIKTEKSDVSDRYWIALDQELEVMLMQSPIGGQQYPNCLMLHDLLTEIKDMIVYLYPNSSLLREELIPSWDIPYMVQLFGNGTDCAEAFISTLAKVIKANCAPKRDHIVDHMVGLCMEAEYIDMFRVCLELIETMKMDLINYRINRNRERLLQGQVERERQQFGKLLRKVEDTNLFHWVSQLSSNYEGESKEIVVEGLLDIILAENSPSKMPETLCFDLGRLSKFRESCQDLLIFACGLMIFHQWMNGAYRHHDLAEMKGRLARILLCSDMKASDIGKQILLVSSRLKGKPHTVDEKKIIYSFIDKMMHPDHQVFKMVRNKIRSSIRNSLLNEKATDYVTKGSLSLVSEELETLIPKVQYFWNVHWTIHSPLYTKLCREAIPK